jgi:two-component system chemotaxis sensor kinase CheA
MDESSLLKQVLAESEELIEGLNADLDHLAEQHARGRIEPDLLNRIFRSAHSLKGIAGMAGLAPIQRVAHQFEDLLDGMRMGRLRPSRLTVAALAEVAEGLGRMVAADRNQAQDAEEERLTAVIDTMRSGGAREGPEDITALVDLDDQIRRTLTAYEEHRLLENVRARRPIFEVRVAFDLGDFEAGFRAISERLAAGGELLGALPGAGEADPAQIAFRILYATDEPRETVVALAGEYGGTAALLSHYPADAVLSSKTELAAEVGGAPEGPEAASSSVRVEIRALDELAVLGQQLALGTGELVARYARLAEALGLSAREEFDLRQQARTVERGFVELEERLVELRLVPLGPTFARARRLVRRVASELGRDVEFASEGEDVRLDKAIVDRISEPVAHLLHNAIDHGIELPGAREAAGKPRVGRVTLRAESSGRRVVISVADDGQGVDIEAVRRAAAARDLDADVAGTGGEFDIIFQPGFSTAETVSSISGRGVGLDAVATAARALGGEIAIESEPGQGTVFRLTLPTTLVMVSAFFVEAGGLTYAVDVNHLSELGLVELPDAVPSEEHALVAWRDGVLPFLALGALLGLSSPARRARRVPCLIVRSGERQVAIGVDRFIDEREVIVKALGRHAGLLRGINGAIDVEDGRVALLLDLPALIASEVRA